MNEDVVKFTEELSQRNFVVVAGATGTFAF